jgi:salicylate 5-hydroxylase small subunit
MNDKNYLLEVSALNASYAHAIDEQDWQAWIDLFVEDCTYKIQPRENFERGFPLCTLSLLSKGMLKDRAYGIKETLFHDPYYQRHVVGIPMIERVENGVIHAQTNYSVFRTKLSQETTVFNVGRYIDEICVTDEGLKFRSRVCVYDTEMIPNSLIYPI